MDVAVEGVSQGVVAEVKTLAAAQKVVLAVDRVGAKVEAQEEKAKRWT